MPSIFKSRTVKVQVPFQVLDEEVEKLIAGLKKDSFHYQLSHYIVLDRRYYNSVFVYYKENANLCHVVVIKDVDKYVCNVNIYEVTTEKELKSILNRNKEMLPGGRTVAQYVSELLLSMRCRNVRLVKE